MKKALITGINGQDGSYLAEHLISLGYEVHGIIRRNSFFETEDLRINHLVRDSIIDGFKQLHYGDMTDEISLLKILNEVQPDEIYNLAAQSHVRISSEMPAFTIKTNGLGVLNLLELAREVCPDAKVYQASSSEMFGNSVDDDGCQRLTTPMTPVSPYGCSKVLAYNLVRHYRNAYGKFYSNGILFNHESPRRGINFVTNKVVHGAIAIKKGLAKNLTLGNLDSYRDWGHSKDYVRAMHLILQHDVPSDWIVATGQSRSVRDLCEYTFSQLGMNYQDYVVQDERFMRPEELKYLRGEPNIHELGWEPEYTFEDMIDEMIEYWQTEELYIS
jgi:GDPmannose 4,6-dehydratase